MRLPPLLVFPDPELGFSLWVAGGEIEESDDVQYVVAQSFLARKSFVSGESIMDEFGQKWGFTSDVPAGFSFSGIVMRVEG